MSTARTRLGALMTTVALAVAPVLVSTAAADAASKPAYPKTGTWVFGDGGGSFVLKAGKGKSADKRYITKLTTLTSESGNGCGATQSTLTLPGKLKLTIFKRGGYSSWGVGKNTPSTSSGVTTTPVKVLVNGVAADGLFSVIWNSDAKSIISTEIDYVNGSGGLVPYCTSYYDYGTHKK